MHSPFDDGRVEALSMDNPVYDLVIGIIEGSMSADNPNLNWKKDTSKCQSSIEDEVSQRYVSAVETRGQKQRRDIKITLKVP